MIPLAHGDLGSADEIIPAIFAVLLLIFVLVRAFVDFAKERLQRRMNAKPAPTSENVPAEADPLD